MGNNLRDLARYCDCLETPWEQYQDSQQDENKQQKSNKQSKNSTNTPGVVKGLEDKKVIFDHPLRENNSELKINYKPNQASQQDLDSLQHETTSPQDHPNDDELDMVDLEKIDPVIKHEARKKLRNKANQPLFIEERTKDSNLRQKDEVTQQGLSNTFEQKPSRNKYFIDNDEAQFYQLQLEKLKKY